MTEGSNYFTEIASTAERVAAMEWRAKVMPVLNEFDQINASVANELVRLHGSENIVERHAAAWDGLKKLIWEIEQGKESES